MIYHTALKGELFHEVGIKDFTSSRGDRAFVADVLKLNPHNFDKCDILYCEPAWKLGYKEFSQRCGSVNDYVAYMTAIDSIIRHTDKPVCLLSGKSSLRLLHQPDSIVPIILNGYKTVIYGWRIDVDMFASKTNFDFIAKLAEKYNCVGDFCCGYGNTGRIFIEQGKHCVLSDANEKCITYIANHVFAG